MTSYRFKIDVPCQSEMRLLGQILSLKLRPGDVVAMRGDLGAGKTTLARNIIRAAAEEDILEVPSPTYSLMQTYITQRFEIRHYDFYRLADADEVQELGFWDDLEKTVSIIEWPENAAAALPADCIEILLSENCRDQLDRRVVQLTAAGPAAARLQRVVDIWFFLKDWRKHEHLSSGEFQVRYLQGDASARSYARLGSPDRTTILMDAQPQPDAPPIRNGMPYSRIAHLAETMHPFIAIGAELEGVGCSVPATYQVDIESGLAVIEDLGSAVFSDLIAVGYDIGRLYRGALDVLVHLSKYDPPVEAAGHKCAHIIPRFDQAVMEIEIELLLDWYLPYALGRPVTEEQRASFLEVWRQQFVRLEQQSGWVLRDFHSPNLIWLKDRKGSARVGLIDYQDALIGHRAYDVVSLLQDARVYVAKNTEQQLLSYYFGRMRFTGLNCDEAQFRQAYALLGAQRNTKILGIFARLAERDKKSKYLQYIPRLLSYLKRCLEHPDLKEIRAWFAVNLACVLRNR